MQVRLLTVVAANSISLAGLVLLIVLTFVFGPKVETAVSPVVRFERVDGFYRDEQKVCWALHVEKLRWADTPRYEFWVRPEQGPAIPTGTYRADDRNEILPQQFQDRIPHQVGERWTRHYCFDIANRIPDLQGMAVVGLVEHHRHPFWRTVTLVPPFVICPLGRLQDGKCGT